MTLLEEVFSPGGAIAATVGFVAGFCADQITTYLGKRRRP